MKRRRIGLVGILILSGILGGVWVGTGAQTKRDIKAAAKSAIDAFFKSPPKSGKAASGANLLATLDDKRIGESSGLAASALNRDVLWTHNDSGSGPYLFAIDRKGRTLARYKVSNADSVDWEDIALGPGADGKPALYIGDIGDNASVRSSPVVYRLPEPAVATDKRKEEIKTAPAEKLPFRYPDGAHNAETLLVHPKTGEIAIVTKSANGLSSVYQFPLPLQPDRVVTLKKVASLTFTSQFGGRLGEGERSTSGGNIAPDGRRVVVRTYLAAYEWNIAPGQSLGDAFKTKPRQVMLPLTRQGESICYRPDGKAWLVTSEDRPTPLYEIPLR